MTFRRQVRWALTRGLCAGAAGVLLAFVAVTLEAYANRPWQGVVAWASVGLLMVGALLVLGGGLARPLQRLAFRHGMPSGAMRALALRHRALRAWLWVNEDGRDRDDQR